MKSLVPAALALVLEAGFLLSVALLPDRPAPASAQAQVAAGPAAPAASMGSARPRART